MWPPSRKVSKGFGLVEGGVCPGVVFYDGVGLFGPS